MVDDRRSPSVAQVRSKVLELCRNGRTSEAFDFVVASGFSPSTQPLVWEILARGSLSAGDKRTAARACDALLSELHLHGDLAVAHANYLIGEGQAETAADLLTSVFGPLPKDQAALRALLLALVDFDPSHALNLFSQVEDPSVDLRLLRADTLRSLNRLDEAAAELEILAARFPGDVRVLVRQARLEERRANWSKAIDFWKLIDAQFPQQREAARLKVVQLQSRFEMVGSAAVSAASFMWPHLPKGNGVDLLTRLEVLSTMGQSQAVLNCLHSAATPGNRDRHPASSWSDVACYLIDNGQIGLAAWLAEQGIPVGSEAATLIRAAGSMFEGFRRDLRDLNKASNVLSPEFLMSEILALAPSQPILPRPEARILLVNATLAAGGAERQFVMLVKALLQAKVPPDRLTVALFSIAKERGHAHFLPALEDLGVRVVNLGDRKVNSDTFSPAARRLLALLPRRLRTDVLPLLDLVQALRPDIIHGWQDRSSIAAGLAGFLAGGAKIVMTARNMQPERRLLAERASFRGIYSRLCASPHVAMAVNSEAGARDYEAWTGRPQGTFAVMHNAIDLAVFPRLPRQPRRKIGKPEIRLLGVFRLAANKRPDLWMRTVARLRERGKITVRPRLVGAGPFLSEIKALQDVLGLDDLVIEQHLTTAENIYGDADMLLLMSRVEGTPNVVIEAQCCGLPVAACDVGGVREAMAPGNLILSPDITPDEAAAEIEDWILRQDPIELDARSEAVRAKYDIARLAETTLRLYQIGGEEMAAV